ncbi:hypothetical protein BDV95DRAFT_590961 [Massariosphaeria phaeospora]|uniref:Serine/threonine-protein kinase ppk6 n=1 Tax=Massariosphaeria phaeospora TaxID=100035 RepID=A0A7C8MUQ3_9PLEO|nr:hypothetical protein BDV95DRAFT_590961 [Massariosphaeria phaeospora]
MSADLFEAFGSAPRQQQQAAGGEPARPKAQTVSSFSFFNDFDSPGPSTVTRPSLQVPAQNAFLGSTGQNKSTAADENDDWGDFEGGTPSEQALSNPDPFSPSEISHTPWPSGPTQQDPFDFVSTQPSHSVQSSTQPSRNLDPSQFATSRPVQISEGWQKAPIVKAKNPADSNVLFDAEENNDDVSDFGDFEAPEVEITPAVPQGASSDLVDLLGGMNMSQSKPPAKSPAKHLGTSEGRSSVTHHKKSVSSSTKKTSVSGFGVVTHIKQPSTSMSSSTAKAAESWDTFDDWEASIPTKVQKSTSKSTPETRSSLSQPKTSSLDFDEPPAGELPPTNVPPPGVLLTLFPPLFAEAHDKLFKPMAAQTLPMRNKLLSEPATVAYLQGCLMLGSVAARIIAGRKLRWKRDQHLSQGMRIGPASSRATSGMKLTGIDKSENMKEEREASDVVRAWKEQIGRLRHVVAAANQIKAGTLGAVPDLQETMPVRTLKQAEGGVPAPQPCMLCGLKREERLSTAEQAVEDSFGEWWLDQVSMHRGCRNFWHQHKDSLRQR